MPCLSATLYEQSIVSYKKVFSKHADSQKIRDALKCRGQVTVSTIEMGNERSINCCLSETKLSHNFSCALLLQYM